MSAGGSKYGPKKNSRKTYIFFVYFLRWFFCSIFHFSRNLVIRSWFWAQFWTTYCLRRFKKLMNSRSRQIIHCVGALDAQWTIYLSALRSLLVDMLLFVCYFSFKLLNDISFVFFNIIDDLDIFLRLLTPTGNDLLFLLFTHCYNMLFISSLIFFMLDIIKIKYC